MKRFNSFISAGIFISALCFSLPVFAEEQTAKAKSVPAQSTRDLPLDDIFSTKPAKVEVVADTLEYDKDNNKVIATGNVVLRHEGVEMTADYAEVETETKKAYARGHVILFKKGEPISKGEEIHYNFENQTGNFPGGRAFSLPWFFSGDDVQQVKEGVKVIQNGSVTTCDLEEPHYAIRAKKVTVYEGDKLVATNVKIYALGKPIFWWPYLVLPLQQQRNVPLRVSAGHNSRFGTFVLVTKGVGITKNIWGDIHADWRSERGFGSGGDLHYDFTEEKNKRLLGKGIVKGYLTKDKRAPTVGAALSGDNAFEENEERTRGRLTYLHRTDFDPYTNIIGRYNRLEDEYFLQEYFEDESRAELEPQSFVTFTKNSENFGFLTHVEKKANRFESMVERLPQAQFDWKTQPFFHERLFYENQTSFANLRKTFDRSDYDEDVVRYDTVHEWSAPLNYNHIKFTPFTNVRGTYYSRDKVSSGDIFRGAWSGGADMRTHFYRTYDVASEHLGIEINQLRHVIEPLVQYKTVKSNVSDEDLNGFDSIDRIDDSDIVTIGMENRIQTKRVINGRIQRVDLISLNSYLSYELHPDGRSLASPNYAPFEDGQTQSNFTIATQEIVLRPYEWLQSETRFDFGVEDGEMRVFNQDIVFRRSRFTLIFGYRFIRDFIDLAGSEQFVFDGKYVINPLWSIGGYLRWDSSELDEWQIFASRDLHDFIFDFGYNVRNSEIENSNKELFFDFRLKAFPVLSLRSGRRAGFGEARIGETVAGANQEVSRFPDPRTI